MFICMYKYITCIQSDLYKYVRTLSWALILPPLLTSRATISLRSSQAAAIRGVRPVYHIIHHTIHTSFMYILLWCHLYSVEISTNEVLLPISISLLCCPWSRCLPRGPGGSRRLEGGHSEQHYGVRYSHPIRNM